MKTDVIIIGGGIVGCATAYYLAQKGLKVMIFEKDPAVGLQASGRNGGGVRQHGRKAALPLAMASVRLWPTLAEELGSDLEYVRTGNINIASNDSIAEGFEREISWEHDHGLKEVKILSAKECQALVPGLTSPIIAGKYCPTDGVANPMLVTQAFARAGLRSGVNIMLNTPVTAILQQGSNVCGVQVNIGEIEAKTVINTAGPWASKFSSQIGCPMPIGPGRSQLLVTERLSNLEIKLWVSIRGYGYIRPTVSGNYVLGTGGVRNDDYSSLVDQTIIALHAERWSQFFPWLNNVKIIRAFSGITEYTPDGEPYIGAVPGVGGYFVAAGFHGEGFCPGPMVGKILAELATGGESSVSLEAFRTDRFVVGLREGNPPPPIVYPWDIMYLSQFNSHEM
jgi:sarcosine oxidase subunit beta